jgi:GTPase SAR1 family protein
MLNTYTVVMLGPRGSGKTVFLASLYKRLSTQGELGFFLEVDSAEKRKRLKNIYTELALEEKWPKKTDMSELSEWTFTCKVQTPTLPIYSACNFTYFDYAGGLLTDESEEDDTSEELQQICRDADALMALLDGQRLCELIEGKKDGIRWSIQDLPNMLDIMQNTTKPIHFVISKWDVVKNKYTLEDVTARLLQIDEFKNVVKSRNLSNTAVRLIPSSSVGIGFAELQSDGSMKKTGKLPSPYQVEMPLACILPDMIKATLEELIKRKQVEENQKIVVEVNLSFWDKLKKAFGETAKTVINSAQHLLPRKYQFANDLLEDFINFCDDVEKSVYEKERVAKQREIQLIKKKEESLKEISNEETALKHVVNCFLKIVNQLEISYPNSNIKI